MTTMVLQKHVQWLSFADLSDDIVDMSIVLEGIFDSTLALM